MKITLPLNIRWYFKVTFVWSCNFEVQDLKRGTEICLAGYATMQGRDCFIWKNSVDYSRKNYPLKILCFSKIWILLSKTISGSRTSKTSFFTILHYGQNITNKCFHAYDWYDSKENIKRYGRETPPLYNLSSVSVPVALFWSTKVGSKKWFVAFH